MKVAAVLLASVVLGNRLLDKSFLYSGAAQGNVNPYFLDQEDLAMYNYMHQNPQASMNPWMMQKMDKEDWALYQMMQGQGGANAPVRGQVGPSAQMNPAVVQALLRSDVGEDLMENDLVQRFVMAKQMQGQPTNMRGRPQGFGDYAQFTGFSGFGQPQASTPTTPQFYPGMDEEMMEWQMMQNMGQQNPGSYNPMMADWDIKDWTRYNWMNQQGSQNTANNAMWMDGDMSDYLMWQSMNSHQQPSTALRGNAIEQMQKMALCQTYLKSMTGDQATQMQAYALYSQAEDIGEDDIRACMMMHQVQTSMANAAAPSTGFDFGSAFGPRTLPDINKNMMMMAWMNKNQGEGQGSAYYPGMDSEDMLEFNFWQRMKEQVANKQQQ